MRKSGVIILCFCMLAGSARFAQGEKPLASVPFIFNGYEVLIAVTVNSGNDTLHFLFDSGCEVNVLSADKAKALGLAGRDEAGVSGWSKGMIMIPKVTARSMKIGSMSIPYPEFYLQDMGHAALQGKSIDGIIGYGLLKRYAVKIDFPQRTMSFYRSGTVDYPPGGDQFTLGINYKTPTLEAGVVLPDGGTLSSSYHLISGGDFGLLFNEDYVKKYALADKLPSTGTITRQDLAGPVTYTKCSVPALLLKRYKITSVPALYSPKINDDAPDKEIAGAIGAWVWKNYIMIIDLPKKVLYLQPADQ